MQANEGVFSMEFGHLHVMAYVEQFHVTLRTGFFDGIASMLLLCCSVSSGSITLLRSDRSAVYGRAFGLTSPETFTSLPICLTEPPPKSESVTNLRV